MAILKFILIFLEVLLIFNLLIFTHELGHFLAARWRGLKVDRFAIWFGKPIWKRKINGVEYALGTIPAGGYVSLPQMASMEMIEGKGESSGQPLPPVGPIDKMIVAFAGPLFSFLLACAFALVVWKVGRPVSGDNSTTVGWVETDGPAWKAGLRPGDVIKSIDGHRVTSFMPPSTDSITWRVITSTGTNIAIDYSRDGKEHTAVAAPTRKDTAWYERKDTRHLMIRPKMPALIYEVISNSPAALAGLRRGDEITAVNGKPILSYAAVEAEEDETNTPPQPVAMTIVRKDPKTGDMVTFERTLKAEQPIQPTNSQPSFGIHSWKANTVLTYPSPASQVSESAGQILATFKALFTPKSEISVGQLGGPVMIVRIYSQLFDSDFGYQHVLWFSVVINVNLALLNLLPFPVLDGGHIVMGLFEAIRRRPLSAKVLQYLQSACAILLIGFMLFIAFYDTGDLMRSARKDQPIVFAPKN